MPDSDRRRRYYIRAPAKELNGETKQGLVIRRTDTDRTGPTGEDEVVIRGGDDSKEAANAKPPGRSLKRDVDDDGDSDSFYGRPTGKDNTGARRPRSQRRQITCLVFGSRVGDYAMIYEDKGVWFLGMSMILD